MLVFVTENYVNKLQGSDTYDYCYREFNYGFQILTPEKMIFIVLDKSMKDIQKWADQLTFNFSSAFLYFNLSEIFEQSTNLPEDIVEEEMDKLYQKIIDVLEEKDQTEVSLNTLHKVLVKKKRKKRRKLDDHLSSNEVAEDLRNLNTSFHQDSNRYEDAKNDPQTILLKALRIACQKKDAEEVKSILDQHPNLFNEIVDEAFGMPLLIWACLHDWDDMVEYLVSDSHSDILNVNMQAKNGFTALYYAADKSKIDWMRLLLSNETIDVNIRCGDFDKPVLWYCSNRECYDLLLPYYTSINEDEKELAWLWYLCRSATRCLAEVQDLMKEIPRNILEKMSAEVSVMVSIAATTGKADIIEYLLSSHGDLINVNIQDKSGRTCLHRAILNDHKDCIEMLVKIVDQTIQDKNGQIAFELSPALKPKAKWYRCKIMLVGQRRDAERASTTGAEQMDMQLFYKEVEGERLDEYEIPKQEYPPEHVQVSKMDSSLSSLQESIPQYERYFPTSHSYFRAADDKGDKESVKWGLNPSFELCGRRNTSSVKVEDQLDESVLASEEMTDVRGVLSDMGLLTWLDDSIILDPIEYLVKPATSMIDKYLATRDHPYKTIHEIQEIHEEGKKEYDEDWIRTMEFGRLSELALNDIWAEYYPHLSDTGVTIRSNNSIDNDLLMMIRFGLLFLPPITSLDNSGNSNSNNVYYIPSDSLLPSDSPSGSGVGGNDGSENGGDDSKESKKQKFRANFNAIHEMPDESWNIGMHYSVFFYLLMDDYPLHKSPCLVCDIISSSELIENGSLPPGFFERFIDLFKKRLSGFQLNEMINCVRGKATLTFSFLEISFIESREEKRIEVIFRTHPDADKMKAKIVFQDIYYIIIDVIDGIRKKSNVGGLQVKTLIHPPPEKTASCDVICINATGFITLTTVRQLLSKLTMPDGSSKYKERSCDAGFIIELNLLRMRRDSYWSVWKEKEMIPLLLLDSSLPSSQLPLTAGKKTHVFLSHDWGIDGNNHHRVKQVSESLKSRGLITWIDDERIVNEIDNRIINGIKHSECMLVFVTENYMKKLDSGNHLDYCKREFNYGFEELGREKVILVVLDEPMKDRTRWSHLLKFNFSSALYSDLSEIFEQSSNTSEDFAKEKMNELHKKIIAVLGLKNVVEQESNEAVDSTRRKSTGKGELSSDEIVLDCDEGVLSSNNNLNNEKRKKKNKKRKRDEFSSDEEEVNHDQSEENNIKKKKKRKNQNDSSLEVKNEQSQMAGNILKSDQRLQNNYNSSKKRRKKRRRLRVRRQYN